MDRITERQLRPLLQERREAVATSWYESIARGSFVQLDPASVQQQVLELTDRAISLLVAEPFVAGEARAMGVALAELRYLPPEAFGCTLEVLARELVRDLPLDVLVPLQSR